MANARLKSSSSGASGCDPGGTQKLIKEDHFLRAHEDEFETFGETGVKPLHRDLDQTTLSTSKAPGHTSSRLSDYSLVKELCASLGGAVRFA
jgi:hypothetical protein